ncbi:MAG: putative virulence factor [Desulfovibrio sp.]|jgi:hypothetical protein|nr:putative virulence factor [Desulfovibrio sp.]
MKHCAGKAMDNEDIRLAERCGRLDQACAAAREWLGRNSALVGRDMEGQVKELRRGGRFFRACAVAAERRMCVGVFGPSQAGKSYLVSGLAGATAGRVRVRVGDAVHDFLSDINPAGGKESTGLVTRFTPACLPAAAQPGIPACNPLGAVHIRLLSFTDVVKILADTYFSDAEHFETPDRDAAFSVLDALEQRKKPVAPDGMSGDDVEELQEFIIRHFRGKPRVQQVLDGHFWDRAVSLAPQLDDAGRAELFGLIWDGMESFTGLLLDLSTALRSLDFTAEAFCGAEALIPRAASIIDTATLGDLRPDGNDLLALTAPSGKTALLPRVYAATLTAELIMPMEAGAADFFAHTDLLDFPGYRSRKMFTNLAEETKDPARLAECFLRGKVSYLFERYCAERELTALLLCIGGGVQEVQGLGGAVNAWIAGACGATPEARSGREKSLFFILTKGDLEFEDKAGAGDPSGRWDTRMFASTEIFVSYGWLKHWDDKGSFDNFFLMRNPTVKSHLFTHDGQGRETALREDFAAYVGRIEADFLHSKAVNEHFRFREESWRSFISPDDGGLSLIRERLAPVCRPGLKREQIRTSLSIPAAQIRDRLRPYLRTDDKEEERREKAVLARELARVLLRLGRNGRFGAFVRLFTIRDQDIYDLYFRVRLSLREAPTDSAPGADEADLDDKLAELFGESDLPRPLRPEKNTPPAQDEAGLFVEHIEKYRFAELQKAAEDLVLQQFFGISGELFSALVHETAKGFVRLGVRVTMEQRLREALRYADADRELLVWKLSALAADAINTYINWLGFDPRRTAEQERRIGFGGKERTLFLSPPAFSGLPVPDEDPADYTDAAVMDRAAALAHLIDGNVNFDGVRDFDPEENFKLKDILESLRIEHCFNPHPAPSAH